MSRKRSQKKRDIAKEMELSREQERHITIFEIACKNNLLPESVEIGELFQKVDISKLYDTQDFQDYIVENSNRCHTCLSMSYAPWWRWLITQKHKNKHEESTENEEFQSKFPELKMGPDFRTE